MSQGSGTNTHLFLETSQWWEAGGGSGILQTGDESMLLLSPLWYPKGQDSAKHSLKDGKLRPRDQATLPTKQTLRLEILLRINTITAIYSTTETTVLVTMLPAANFLF